MGGLREEVRQLGLSCLGNIRMSHKTPNRYSAECARSSPERITQGTSNFRFHIVKYLLTLRALRRVLGHRELTLKLNPIMYTTKAFLENISSGRPLSSVRLRYSQWSQGCILENSMYHTACLDSSAGTPPLRDECSVTYSSPYVREFIHRERELTKLVLILQPSRPHKSSRCYCLENP